MAPPTMGSRLWNAASLYLTGKFARFVVFGGLAALVNLGVGRWLYAEEGTPAAMPYWLAVTLAASSGMVVNFGLNYVWNFGFRGRGPLLQFRTFVVVAMIGVGLTALVADGALRLLALAGVTAVRLGGVSLSAEFLSHVFAVGAVTFYSFAAHSTFSFNRGIRAWFADRLAGR